jgi:hypothetical protein
MSYETLIWTWAPWRPSLNYVLNFLIYFACFVVEISFGGHFESAMWVAGPKAANFFVGAPKAIGCHSCGCPLGSPVEMPLDIPLDAL